MRPGSQTSSVRRVEGWPSTLKLSETDRLLLEGDLALLESLDGQVDRVTRRAASEAYGGEDVKLLMTMPGVDLTSTQPSWSCLR